MKKMPARVCHLITYLGDGGAERVLFQTVRRLSTNRFTSHVVSLRGPGPMSPSFAKAGIDVAYLGMHRHPGPRTIFRLVAWLRENRIDIVHAYLYHATILARLSGRIARVPVVITSTRCSLGYLPRPALWVDRWTAPLGDRIVAVSRGTANFIVQQEGISESRVVVVPNGVDLDRFRPTDRSAARHRLELDDNAFVMCVIGRLHAQKGHTYLFRALSELKKRLPNFVCLIAGDGPLAEELVQEAQRNGIEAHCRFLGRLADTRPLYAASDICVLPSLYEGMPNVVLEAMAMGCPTVATRVAGSEELIIEGVNGLLVAPRDPAALCDAIYQSYAIWAGDEAARRAIRTMAETEHGLDRIVKSIESLYSTELDRKRRT